MNKQTGLVAVLAMLLGLAVGYWLGDKPIVTAAKAQPSPPVGGELAVLREELSTARRAQAELQQQLAVAQRRSQKAEMNMATREAARTDEPLSEVSEIDERAVQFSAAMEAIENGDVPEASRLLNGLLVNAENNQQRDEAQRGLLVLFKANYNRQRAQGDQTPAALWSLFEIHKLEPSADLKYEIISLSEQAYAEAEQYRAQDDLLATADRFTSLMHLSKMVDYELATSDGRQLGPRQFQVELQKIERQPDYVPLLQNRAATNLYSGDERTRANVFWDYAKLATLQGRESLDEPAFRQQFVEATVAHMEYLRAINKPGDLRSRMDYIRYVFPQIAQLPELTVYN